VFVSGCCIRASDAVSGGDLRALECFVESLFK
jgi:hypothetical protein